MTNENYEIIKKAIAEANTSFWKQKAIEMFAEFKDEGYTICGKPCLKQEAIESFEKYSGLTLNELGVKAHD